MLKWDYQASIAEMDADAAGGSVEVAAKGGARALKLGPLVGGDDLVHERRISLRRRVARPNPIGLSEAGEKPISGQEKSTDDDSQLSLALQQFFFFFFF